MGIQAAIVSHWANDEKKHFVNQTAPDDDPPPKEPQLKLWHAFAAVGGLSVIFALLVMFNMAQAIGGILAVLALIGLQALLLGWVMRRLRQQAAAEKQSE